MKKTQKMWTSKSKHREKGRGTKLSRGRNKSQHADRDHSTPGPFTKSVMFYNFLYFLNNFNINLDYKIQKIILKYFKTISHQF